VSDRKGVTILTDSKIQGGNIMGVVGSVGPYELLLVLVYLIGFGIALVIPISILVIVYRIHKQLMEQSKAIEKISFIFDNSENNTGQ
jgi:hypothetical protein